jgi:hypothetical protein
MEKTGLQDLNFLFLDLKKKEEFFLLYQWPLLNKKGPFYSEMISMKGLIFIQETLIEVYLFFFDIHMQRHTSVSRFCPF